MSNKERLAKSIKRIGLGYIFIYFHFKLGTMDLLPSWFSYIVFFRLAIIDGIAEEESSANLLKPLCIILGIYNLIIWFITMFGGSSNIYLVSEIASALELYFHFQLLTNLASIAEKYSCLQTQSIRTLRTIQTILLTIYFFVYHYIGISDLIIWVAVVQLIIVICICIVLSLVLARTPLLYDFHIIFFIEEGFLI